MNRNQTLGVAGLIAIAAVIAYGNSFTGPFVFDDIRSIVGNPTIQSLWPPSAMLHPPYAAGATVGGRPILNLSLAVNYAVGGTHVAGYHAVNLLIHILAGWTLFGIIRRTVERTHFATNTLAIAGVGSCWWIVHPLQTESVTYIVQRAESLSGLFYLLTLYAFIRGAHSSSQQRWFILAVAACLLGIGTKETVATAPVMVLLYDRAFVSGSFRAALASRRSFYAALASTWIVLAALIMSTHGRGDTVGFRVGVTSWGYAISQVRALTSYLRLSLFPHPLVFDRGGILAFENVIRALPFLVVLVPLGIATLVAQRRWPRWGFVGAWFFLILAPSSSFVPLLDSMFEHRMYLSLAAPLLLVVLGAFSLIGDRALPVLIAAALGCGVLAASRNAVYHDAATLWSSALAERPNNPRAHFELANVLLEKTKIAAAIVEYREAIRLDPDYVEAHNNLGAALLQDGHPVEALAEIEATIRKRPLAEAHFTAATALTQLQRLDEARKHYDEALRLKPDYSEALNNRGNLHLQGGHAAEALSDYEMALRLSPQYPDAYVNASVALLALGRLPEALSHCETAVRLRPDFAAGHWKLGEILLEARRVPEAIARFREALRLDPGLVYAHYDLARALAQSAFVTESLAEYERTLQLAPDWAAAHYQYSLVLESSGQIDRAIAQLETTLRLQAGFAEAAARLSQLKSKAGSKITPKS